MYSPVFEALLGPSWDHVGALRRPRWGHLGSIPRRFPILSRPIVDSLRIFQVHLESILGHLGPALGIEMQANVFACFWSPLGAILGSCWGPPGSTLDVPSMRPTSSQRPISKPKMAQEGSKMAPREPQAGPRWPHEVCVLSAPQNAHFVRPQEGPRRP